MRRVIGWSIPLVLIADWAAVAAGVHGGGNQELPADDPVVFSNFKADFRRQRRRQPGCRGDHHRRVPRRAPRPLPVLGHRQPEQPVRAAGARYHSRCGSTVRPRRTRCCGRTGSGSGWPRSAIPDEYLSFGTHVFEIRYTVPGVLDPGEYRRATRDSPNPPATTPPRSRCSSGTSSRRLLEQPDAAGRHLGHAAERRHRRAVFGRRRGRCTVSATSPSPATRSSSRPRIWDPARRSRCGPGSMCRRPRATNCCGPTPGIGSSARR